MCKRISNFIVRTKYLLLFCAKITIRTIVARAAVCQYDASYFLKTNKYS
ncbi:hypothetical protein HMPREF1584_00163 [Gardnerella vaginalis JCP8481A]|nr:hypothetical protein HMPREF1584_00163 [Gardnerella vaginalis JCP8481A]